MKKKVVLGMSGGVDSFVSALLLKEAGYDVTGITFKFFSEQSGPAKRCCGVTDIKNAFRSSGITGIPHYTVNLEDDFRKEVIEYFIRSYAGGLTPNPCVICNSRLKFPYLDEWRKKLGADYIATGHYAGINKKGKEGKEEYFLREAKDKKKDQTYFLGLVDKKYLKRTIFPLQDILKEKVKEYAREKSAAGFIESQDVCFAASGDYRKIIPEGKMEKTAGRIVTTEGAEAGWHKGIAGYTIGQSRGFGAHKEKMYIVDIDRKNNTIVIGSRAGAMKKIIRLSGINFFSSRPESGGEYSARVRYRSPLSKCFFGSDKSGYKVEFKNPVFAPAPGQLCAVYDDELLFCAGVIKEVIQ